MLRTFTIDNASPFSSLLVPRSDREHRERTAAIAALVQINEVRAASGLPALVPPHEPGGIRVDNFEFVSGISVVVVDDDPEHGEPRFAAELQAICDGVDPLRPWAQYLTGFEPAAESARECIGAVKRSKNRQSLVRWAAQEKRPAVLDAISAQLGTRELLVDSPSSAVAFEVNAKAGREAAAKAVAAKAAAKAVRSSDAGFTADFPTSPPKANQ